MVCWEGNFKIKQFPKKHLSAQVIRKSPRLEVISSAGLVFVALGFSHIVLPSEQAPLLALTRLLSWR